MRCPSMSGNAKCELDDGHPLPHHFDHTTPEAVAAGALVDAATAELKAATIALRDAALAGKAAQARYQAALSAFNRAVAPGDV